MSTVPYTPQGGIFDSPSTKVPPRQWEPEDFFDFPTPKSPKEINLEIQMTQEVIRRICQQPADQSVIAAVTAELGGLLWVSDISKTRLQAHEEAQAFITSVIKDGAE